MATINYAEQYSKELANAYGYSLYSGALWSVENANKYKVVDAKTIKIPTLTVGGRVNGDTATIGSFTQNFSNNWETKTLSNHRCFQTLIHPSDIDRTNQVASIANITKTFNETQKFPEMDAYTFSKLYELKNAQEAITAQSAELTGTTAIKLFDELMDKMDRE